MYFWICQLQRFNCPATLHNKLIVAPLSSWNMTVTHSLRANQRFYASRNNCRRIFPFREISRARARALNISSHSPCKNIPIPSFATRSQSAQSWLNESVPTEQYVAAGHERGCGWSCGLNISCVAWIKNNFLGKRSEVERLPSLFPPNPPLAFHTRSLCHTALFGPTFEKINLEIAKGGIPALLHPQPLHSAHPPRGCLRNKWRRRRAPWALEGVEWRPGEP